MLQKVVDAVRHNFVPKPTKFERDAAEAESKTQAELAEIAKKVTAQIDAERSAKEAAERNAAHAAGGK